MFRFKIVSHPFITFRPPHGALSAAINALWVQTFLRIDRTKAAISSVIGVGLQVVGKLERSDIKRDDDPILLELANVVSLGFSKTALVGRHSSVLLLLRSKQQQGENDNDTYK